MSSGTAVFFDPGPRGSTLFHGTPDERRALDLSLRLSDVLLLTSDEVIFLNLYYTVIAFNFIFTVILQL